LLYVVDVHLHTDEFVLVREGSPARTAGITDFKLFEAPGIAEAPVKIFGFVRDVSLSDESMDPRRMSGIKRFAPRDRRFLHHRIAIVNCVVEDLGVVYHCQF